MKKKIINKVTAQVKRNTKAAMKAKKRNKKNVTTVEYVRTWEPGPSPRIKHDANGKVVGFMKWCNSHKRQKDYQTKMAQNAMSDNHKAGLLKKKLIREILKEAGYDPTIRYTRKEKKKFTRAVKNKLFVKSKLVSELTPYTYRVYRSDVRDTNKSYPWLTDKTNSCTPDDVLKELPKIARRYSKDECFAGIQVLDLKGKNSVTFFPSNYLLAS